MVAAAQQYASILEQYPKNSKAIKGLASIRQHGILTTQIKSAPSQTEIENLLGLYNQGAWEEALERGQILASQFHKSELIFNLLGVFNAGVRQLDAAIENYRKAIHLEPEYVQAHSNLGNALNELGRHEEAIECYAKAIQLRPDYVQAHSNMGNTFNDIGRYEEAVGSLLKAIELKPDLVEAYHNLGVAFNALDKHDEAIESFTKAIRLKPDLADAHYGLGGALNSNKLFTQALASYVHALEIKPDFDDATGAMGVVLRSLGRLEEGLEQEEIGYGAICFDNVTGVSIKHGKKT